MPTTSRTSVTLLEALQKRSNPDDWNRFIKAYTPFVYQWTRQLKIPPALVEDLIQEVFLQVHRKIPVFRYDSAKSFRSWLKRLLKNLYIDFTRKKKIPVSTGHNFDDFPDTIHEEFWAQGFRRNLLQQGMDGIRREFPPVAFEAFELSTCQGKSVEETAGQLGVTLAVVYQSRSRVLKRLREFIHEIWD